MKKLIKNSIISCLFFTVFSLLSACKNDDPSVLKVYVRSASNELMASVGVVIIGDLDSDPATLPFVDTIYTNPSGYATFNMDTYFSTSGESNTTGYFNIVAKKDGKIADGYVRCRSHITTVETIFLSN